VIDMKFNSNKKKLCEGDEHFISKLKK